MPAPVSRADYRIAWSGLTHVGRVRSNNEDAFLALTFDGHQITYLGKEGVASTAHGDFVFAVSDGMGGARSGEFASKIAVEKITRHMPTAFRMAARGMASGFGDILQEIIASIHTELSQLGRSYEECAGMGATLTLLWVTPEWAYFAHVGDSRLYHRSRAGELKQVSHDHSYVGWLRRQEKLNEREQRTHPRRNVLQQALGGGHQFVDPQIGAIGYQTGDRFLLCSDGLTDGLWDHALADALAAEQPMAGSAGRLVQASVEASGRDNTTALVVDIGRAELPT
ncbi:PP2C family protein-serine/threonine phosphatase [Nibricoccus sp. IMCC34717]|uniref:PP2C family protein-serine/threonine phosphatase n=1 Tax=Nibricoccus sp. IMCC34717 TaxID=3034021 RepID=UPI00384B85D7